MGLYSLKIEDKEFKVAVVSEEKAMRKGLSNAKKLKKFHGMLFDFKKEDSVTMNMHNMNYGIDMLFIDSSLTVIKVVSLDPEEEPITVDNVRFVLEINKGEGKGTLNKKVEMCECLLNTVSLPDKEEEKEEEHTEKPSEDVSTGMNIIIRIETVPANMQAKFKRGGTIKMYEEDIKIDNKKMQVLDDKGRVLMNISGGERIFSIEHTNKLVDLADKVKRGEADEEELGKLMKQIIEIQNNQEPEYV